MHAVTRAHVWVLPNYSGQVWVFVFFFFFRFLFVSLFCFLKDPKVVMEILQKLAKMLTVIHNRVGL